MMEELKSFDEVAKSINRSIAASDAINKYVWASNCKKCKWRPKDPIGKAIRCRYPERINNVNENNCRYEVCPLIHRQGGTKCIRSASFPANFSRHIVAT